MRSACMFMLLFHMAETGNTREKSATAVSQLRAGSVEDDRPWYVCALVAARFEFLLGIFRPMTDAVCR